MEMDFNSVIQDLNYEEKRKIGEDEKRKDVKRTEGKKDRP